MILKNVHFSDKNKYWPRYELQYAALDFHH